MLLYADKHLLVLDKPAGLLCVPGRGEDKQDCLSARVQQQFPDALIVHRLDMATSGLLLMARGLAAQRALNRQFEQRLVHKRYAAIVAGNCSLASDLAQANSSDWQRIDLPIAVDWPNRPLRKIDPLVGKPSETLWRCTEYDAQRDVSRLELAPLTGRSHQLRVHLQAIGHPILGDAMYAPPRWAEASPRLLLHACHIAFQHPDSGEPVTFTCPDRFTTDWRATPPNAPHSPAQSA